MRPGVPRRTTKRTPADVRRRQERRAVRVARYERMVALAQEGVSARQIAQEVGVAPATVYRYLAASSFPEHFFPQRPRPTDPIDPYIPYLQERWNAGEHNALTLWRAIHAPSMRRATPSASHRYAG
jgi:transposase